MMFRAGQKVVCIDAEGASELELNGIYTIKMIGPPCLCRWRKLEYWGPAIHLYEALPDHSFHGFAHFRFRPAIDRPTDISIFKKMLNVAKGKEPVEV